MSHQYTPGRWRVAVSPGREEIEKPEICVVGPIYCGDRPIIAYVTDSHDLFASERDPYESFDSERAKPNAYLIAAAPALLEACQDALECLRSEPQCIKFSAMMSILSDAIGQASKP